MCDSILETLPVTRNGVKGLDTIITNAALRNNRKRKALQELDKGEGSNGNKKPRRKWYKNKENKTAKSEPESARGKISPKAQN